MKCDHETAQAYLICEPCMDADQSLRRELLEALKECKTMTGELLRTMDDGHWYHDDLAALRVKIINTLARAEATL